MNINCLFFFSSSITTSFPNTFLPGKFKLQISPKADWGGMVPAASTSAPQRLVSCCGSAQLPGAEQHHAWDEAAHPQFG